MSKAWDGRREDLRGQKFGRLLVVDFYDIGPRKACRWTCLCDCGTKKVIYGSDLKKSTVSCGCYQREKVTTHGGAGTRLHKIWHGVRNRCRSTTHADYHRYGGAGVRMHDEWYQSFPAFRDWALANGYNDTLTLDRVNPFGNYEPSNLRWADRKTQNNNKRYHHELRALRKIVQLIPPDAALPEAVHTAIQEYNSLLSA